MTTKQPISSLYVTRPYILYNKVEFVNIFLFWKLLTLRYYNVKQPTDNYPQYVIQPAPNINRGVVWAKYSRLCLTSHLITYSLLLLLILARILHYYIDEKCIYLHSTSTLSYRDFFPTNSNICCFGISSFVPGKH